jgi:hypothetical protein
LQIVKAKIMAFVNMGGGLATSASILFNGGNTSYSHTGTLANLWSDNLAITINTNYTYLIVVQLAPGSSFGFSGTSLTPITTDSTHSWNKGMLFSIEGTRDPTSDGSMYFTDSYGFLPATENQDGNSQYVYTIAGVWVMG